MLFKLSNLNSSLTLTLGYLNPALNNLALMKKHNKFPRKGEGLDGNSVQSPHSKIAGQLT